MSERIFSSSERKAVEALAKERGFKSLREYMRSLIELDAKQHGQPAPLEGDDELDDPAESFRIAWGQAMRGELLTEEEFWKAIDEDE